MEVKLILSKNSSESEIKRYFNAILKLAKSNEEYPVNLDEVWPLIYGRKQEAVRALVSEIYGFVQGVDYQVVRKDAQRAEDGQFIGGGTDYYLTISCMEFFIARKVRPVFEVYRKVFHKVTENKQYSKPIGLKDQITWVKEVKKMLNLNDASTLSLLQKLADPLNLPLPNYTPSKDILKSATELLTKRGLIKEIKAHMFNSKVISNGFLCEKVRDSSKGSKKKFKSITEKGLQYGENQVHPNNPKETQPLWYDGTFDELLILLGFKISA